MIQRRTLSVSCLAGFTLLEVMLALIVCGIVLAAVNGVYFGALKLRNRTSANIEAALPIQHAVAVIKRDLTGIMLPGGSFGGPFQSTPTNTMNVVSAVLGVRTSPDIYTNTGIIDENTEFAAVQRVAYYLAVPTNNAAGSDLMRGVTRDLLPITVAMPDPQFLMSGVAQLTMQFYDGSSWAETWDSTTATNLPLAVKVQITLTPEDRSRQDAAPIEFIVPVMVQARTNVTTTATGGGA